MSFGYTLARGSSNRKSFSILNVKKFANLQIEKKNILSFDMIEEIASGKYSRQVNLVLIGQNEFQAI